MGMDSIRRWLSIIFQKIGGIYKNRNNVGSDLTLEDRKKLMRFFSSDNAELPETQCNSENGKSSTCDHLLFQVDLTQVLIKAYQKNYGEIQYQSPYSTFERYVVSKIVSHLANMDSRTCILCGLPSSGFNSWSYSSPNGTSFNSFDAPKTTQNPGDHRMSSPSPVCQCAKELDICQLLDSILKYTNNNPNKSIRIVLLYDSRNLNPLSRSIINAARYSEQSTIMTAGDILNWFKRQEQNSTTCKMCDLGYDRDTNINFCLTNVPIISDFFVRGCLQLKNDDFFKNYLKPRFLLFTIENWLRRLNNRIGDFLATRVPLCSASSCNHQSNPRFNPTTNFELVIDSLPMRSENMYSTCTDSKSYSFRNPIFIKTFYSCYGNTIGTSQSKIWFYMDTMLKEATTDIGNISVGGGSEERKPETYSENQINNLLSWYPTFPNVNIQTQNPKSGDESTANEENPSCYFRIFDQIDGITNNIGESDIKILPYIVSFIDDIIGDCGDSKSTVHHRIIIDSEDADLIPICLLFVSNNVCARKRIGNILAKNPSIILSENFSIILDRGVKMNHDNYKKLKCDSEKIEDKERFLKNASAKATNDPMFVDSLDLDFINPDANDDDENVLVVVAPNHPDSVGKNQNGRSRTTVQILETMSEKDFGNIRMLDITALYMAFCDYLTSDFVEQFAFYMFMNGCDYVQHPYKMGVEKFVTVFETYAHQKPFNLFCKPSERIQNCSIGELSSHQEEAACGSLLVRHLVDKKRQNYVWVCNKERAFVFAILLYHTTLPKVFAPIKKTVLQDLTKLLNNGLHLDNLETPHSHINSNNKTKKVTTAQSIYSEFREMVLKKDPKVSNFWTENEVIGEMYRCTWTINYYLGCEFDCMHSVERRMNGAIWGWTIVPIFKELKEQFTFNMDLINFLENSIVKHADGKSFIGDNCFTYEMYWEYIHEETNVWKKYMKCIQILQSITKEVRIPLRIVPDNMLLFDHYCLY